MVTTVRKDAKGANKPTAFVIWSDEIASQEEPDDGYREAR